MNFYKKLQQLSCLLISLTALTTSANQQTLISQNDLLYPRVIKLSHNADASKNGAIIATGTAFDSGPQGAVFISNDNGENFSPQGRALELFIQLHYRQQK